MDLKLDGQTVAVFGAARGIGRAIAEGFVAQKCRVLGFDLHPHLAAEPSASFAITQGDVTEADQVRRFSQSIPNVDHVVFCVGVGSGGYGAPFWNVPPQAWSHVLEVNLVGAVRVAHAFAPVMAARRQGTFLFLTSVAGQIGSQTDPPYSASKAGLINFMQCAARDLAGYDVRANALAPGMVKTELNRSVWSASQQRVPEGERIGYEPWAETKIRGVTPLGRWQQPEEFASMATYLASEHARNITGQTFNIDGGWVMHA